jgi:hypothetical protein
MYVLHGITDLGSIELHSDAPRGASVSPVPENTVVDDVASRKSPTEDQIPASLHHNGEDKKRHHPTEA